MGRVAKRVLIDTLFVLGCLAVIYGAYNSYIFFSDFDTDKHLFAPLVIPFYFVPAIILFWIGIKLHRKWFDCNAG